MNLSSIVSINDLHYRYPKSSTPNLDYTLLNADLFVGKLGIRAGERVVLCGCNGAGKSTLLSIIGGKKHINRRSALVLGRQCFNDCTLCREVCYLGDWWRTDFFLDVTIEAFLGEKVRTATKCEQLCKVLQVDLGWRISQLSDGQRRRCQILAALTASESFKVYVLDEVTADLDIVSRERLLNWLKNESEEHGATVLLATHIMDGLNEWATRLIYMEKGSVREDLPVTPEMNIYSMIRAWMMEQASVSE